MTTAPTRPLTRGLVFVALGLVVGVVAGVLWEWLWTPPTGVAFEGDWFLDGEGLQNDVSGTGWFTLVGLGAGLVVGLAGAATARGREVGTLVSVLLGAVLATAVMALVGPALGPPDPHAVAATAEDLTSIPSDLSVSGVAPYLALTFAALLPLAVVFLSIPTKREDAE